jgi:WD40 repeat protein
VIPAPNRSDRVDGGSFPIGVRVYELPTGREVWARPEVGRGEFVQGIDTAFLATITFSPDGLRVAVGYQPGEGEDRVWFGRSDDGSDVLTAAGQRPGSSLGSLLWFSPDGQWLARASGTEVLGRDAGTGRLVHRLRGHNSPPHQILFSPEGGRLFSLARFGGRPGQDTAELGGELARLMVWDLATGRELISLQVTQPPHPVNGSVWPPPVFVDGRLYLPGTDGLQVLDGTPASP